MSALGRALRFAAACITAIALCSPNVAAKQKRLLVVPFGDVSAVSGKMPPPTPYLIARLVHANIAVAEAPWIDPIVAATNAPALCHELGAGGMLLGTMNLTSSPKFEAPVGVLNLLVRGAAAAVSGGVGAVTGGVGASGALARTALQAQVHLYLLDCEGHLRWHAITAANQTHHGNNVGAGYTQIVQQAIGEAVRQFMASCHPERSGLAYASPRSRGAAIMKQVSTRSNQATEPHFRVGSCLEPIRSAQAR